jgi:hypothetical protein
MTDSRLQVRGTPPDVNLLSRGCQTATSCHAEETWRAVRRDLVVEKPVVEASVSTAAVAREVVDARHDDAARGISRPLVSANLATLTVTSALDDGRPQRTSELLRRILTQNPGVKAFSVERILAAVGADRFDVSLMAFSLPAIVPIRRARGMAALPTGAIAYQLIAGEKRIQLPRFVLKKTVSRRALAVAIHGVLPVLQAAERLVKPRWAWVNHPSTHRAIGLFAFLLAVAVAFPLFGFSPLHATSIFVMAFGMAEQDGLAVLLGAIVGVLSLAIVAASGTSTRVLRAKVSQWLRNMGKKLGLRAFAHYLRRRGYATIARLLTFEWSTLLLLWDPERSGTQRAATKTARASALAV